MDALTMNSHEDPVRFKASITTRLIAAVAFTIPLIGGALSSFLMLKVFQSLKANESAGIEAVMAGMKESSFPMLVSLYLAAVLGFVVVAVLVTRMFVQTKTASPPFWFFIIGGILSFMPAVLFWKCQLLVLDILSPGSTIGSAGIGAVGADIAEKLLISIISAPIIFVILLILSVVPLPSRPGTKIISLIMALGVTFAFIATAIGIPKLIDGPKRKNEIVALPTNIKGANEDAGLTRDASMILTLTADNKLHQLQAQEIGDRVERTEALIAKEELTAKIRSSMETKTPEKRIVYFKCDVNASSENVIEVFNIIRSADVDRVALVVIGAKDKDDPYQIAPLQFEVRLQEPFKTNLVIKPNPLTLVAFLDKDGNLELNNELKGKITDASRVETTLKNIFKDREGNGIFREGTNEIEKKVIIKVSKASKYADMIKLIEAVKAAKAEPIMMQLDDLV